MRILDGLSLRAEDNWSGGLSWSPTPQYTDGYPYGLSMGDLDGDGYPELAMGSDRGYLWVVNISTPERYYPWNDVGNNDPEWLIDLAVVLDIPEGLENIWGLYYLMLLI